MSLLISLLAALLCSGYSAALQPADRAWPASLTRHVSRGIAVTISEAAARDGVTAGGATAAKLSAMVMKELVIFPMKMIPFAVRTYRYRASAVELPPAGGGVPPGLEVYSSGGSADGPIVLYVHGGSWGQGEPWQYALLARRLLEGGASRVAVAKYRLFPNGDVEDMLADVDAALEWCRAQQEEAAEVSGERPRVVLAAQSAGAHLCALHLTRRAMRQAASGGAHEHEHLLWAPDKFVALSGGDAQGF